MSIRDDVGVSVRAAWYALLATGLVIGAASLVLVWKPWQMAYQREVFQQSRQYVEAKQRLLMKLATDYETARADGGGHATVLLDRIRSEAALLPDSEVPGPVLPYLRGVR